MTTTVSFARMAVLSSGLLLASVLAAQQQPPPDQTLAPDQLDGLVAPIALYPDPLLGQILVASTYPLELVQANQWLQQNPGLSGPALTQAAEQQQWDPSIQALVVFPEVITRLNQDVRWTTNLGNAFLDQQPAVMDAVQRMRLRAQQAGRLPSTNQEIVTESNESGQPIVDIEPANPQMMYVPEYDPAYMWGPSPYYPYAQWSYPSYSAFGGAYFGFGLGISMGTYFGGGWGGWGGWGWQPGWSNHTVVVNNNFIHRNNFNSSGLGNLSGNTAWSHQPTHRAGVPYSNAAVSGRFGTSVRQNLAPRAAPTQSSGVPAGQRALSSAPAGGGQVRSATTPEATQRIGNRQIAPSAPNRQPSAFRGVQNGSVTRSQSDHGYSSLGPARSAPAPAPARSAPSQAPRSSPARSGGNGQQRR